MSASNPLNPLIVPGDHTATLVREDNKEDDVFALIGPKKYDVPWKEMEKQGWIARATCTEIRLPRSRRPVSHDEVFHPRRCGLDALSICVN